MITADPTKHLSIGFPDLRCWNCGTWSQPEHWPDTAQPLGDCSRVHWSMKVDGRDARQMTHADDVCAKHEAAGRSIDEREEFALRAGLG